MTELKKLMLITNILCPFARRTMILARQKNLDFEEVKVDLRNKSQFFKQCYSKCINKQAGFDGKVPIFFDGTRFITDSQIIVYYMAEKYNNQGHQILPEDAFERVQMRLFIQNFTNKLGGFVGTILNWNKKSEQQKKTFNQNFQKFLESLNQNIKLPYALGQQFTIVDLMLYPNLQRWDAFTHFTGVKIEKKYENIFKYIQNVQQRQSVKSCIQTTEVYIEGIKHFYV